MSDFNVVTCSCGNTIYYKTIRNKITCHMCSALLDAIPCTEEELNSKHVEDEKTDLKEE